MIKRISEIFREWKENRRIAKLSNSEVEKEIYETNTEIIANLKKVGYDGNKINEYKKRNDFFAHAD